MPACRIMSIWVLSDNGSYRTMWNNHLFLALNISQGQIEGSWAPITLSRHQQHQCDASLSRPMLWIAENLSLPSRKHSLLVELTILTFNTLKYLSSRLVFKGGFSHVKQPRMHWQLPFIHRVAWFYVLESWVNWRNLIKVVDRLHRIAIYLCVCVSISIKTTYIQNKCDTPVYNETIYICGRLFFIIVKCLNVCIKWK